MVRIQRELNKLEECLFGIAVTAMILLPLFLAIAYKNHQLHNNCVIADGASRLFIYPPQNWFFVPLGIFVNLTILFLLIIFVLIVSKRAKDFRPKIWLAIVVFGWIGAVSTGVDSFNDNKNSYILIDSDTIECCFENKTDIIDISQITNISYDNRAFVISYTDKYQNALIRRTLKQSMYKKCRISAAMIDDLCGRDDLRQELVLLLNKHRED